MPLEFNYSLDYELERVLATLKKMKWYTVNGYSPSLPKGIKEDSSREDIIKQIRKENVERDYIEVSAVLQRGFSSVEKKFLFALDKYLGFKQKRFDISLTRYGTGGSYHLPNKVVYKISNKKGYKTILHEIVHLANEKDIVKNKVAHWEKERIIDLILNSEEFSFLKYSHWQKNYHGTENYVDQIFKKYFFKDRSKFYKALADARLSNQSS